MGVKELASNYRRYFHRDHSGHWDLADNAPSDLWKFVAKNRDLTNNRDLLHDAVTAAATGTLSKEKDVEWLLKWIVTKPELIQVCDKALGDKAPPKTLQKVLNAAYSHEFMALYEKLHAHCMARLNI